MNGEWIKTASHTYRHESGIEVSYRPNNWDWQIVGGPNDGTTYKTLQVALWYARKAA